jgi:hypothetical protein
MRTSRSSIVILALLVAGCSDNSVTSVGRNIRPSADVTPTPSMTLSPTSGPVGTVVTATVVGVPAPCPTCGDKTTGGVFFPDADGNGTWTYTIPDGTPLGPYTFVTFNGFITVTADFTVTPALPTTQQISALLSQYIDNAGNIKSLEAKLRAIQASLDRGDLNSASGQRDAFINEVNALRGKHGLDDTEADTLIQMAGELF